MGHQAIKNAEDKFVRFVVETYLNKGYSQNGIEEAFILPSAPFDLKYFTPTVELPEDADKYRYFSCCGIYFKVLSPNNNPMPDYGD